ncbi:DUF2218 domain-containing protein [Sphingomonas quercus]|uniref:DUF2218 domain-containing protein n=1 Tax=Sphingomonas quercus TaxID=2842451 RepID=A0ABS6BHG6_9SPHN|nr:DUF2218 domain-containing protein [Sphingomonas quercus]
MSAVTTARVPTAHASRYLQQLSKHWSHKLAVTFTPHEARIDFNPRAPAVVTMAAAADALTVRLETEDEALIERMTGVVAEHLDRFAFREAPLPFDWQRQG